MEKLRIIRLTPASTRREARNKRIREDFAKLEKKGYGKTYACEMLAKKHGLAYGTIYRIVS